MSLSRRVLRTSFSALRCGAVGLALVCGGCAAKQTASHVAGPQASPAGASTEPRSWRTVVEDDGLPSQVAPRSRTTAPDDPREPFSPNYGTAPVQAGSRPLVVEPEKASAPSTPTRKRPQAHRRFEEFDADEVIRRAIAEHEMRAGRL